MNEDQILIRIPAREHASVHFVLDNNVNNDTPYKSTYVRRLAWTLMQALPLHVIENLIYELMVGAQETIIRGARMEASQKGRRLFVSVQDVADSPFPGSLQLWYDNEVPEGQSFPADDGEEFEVGESPIIDDEEADEDE